MSQISVHAPLPATLRRAATRRLFCPPRSVKLLAAAAMLLVATDQLWLALQSPAQTIASELGDAATTTDALSWRTPPVQVQASVARLFPGQAVRVDAARFPSEVAVTLAGLDRHTCREARKLAGRIEGTVVVALDGYGAAADCRGDNAMTWRIMP